MAPHGVIIGPDGAPWVTDSGLNAILRVDPDTREVKRWLLPSKADGANLNTAAFDGKGRIWFTGQSGVFGRLDPKTGDMKIWDAPRGTGPYGITGTLSFLSTRFKIHETWPKGSRTMGQQADY